MAPWNAAVCCRRARGDAAGLRQYRRAEGFGTLPAHAWLVGEVLTCGGLPQGALNVIHSSPEKAPEIVEALIAHPAVRRVNFTGSTRVGRMIAEMAPATSSAACWNSAARRR